MLSRKGNARVFKEWRGKACGFRVAIPKADGIGAIKVDDAWVRVKLSNYTHGKPADGSMTVDQSTIDQSIRTLEDVVNARSDVIIGVDLSAEGQPELLWLLSNHGNLIPPSLSDWRSKGQQVLARWLPWFIPSLAIFAWSLSSLLLGGGFGYTFLLLAACFPLLIGGFSIYFGLMLIVRTWTSRWAKEAELVLQKRLRKLASAGLDESSLTTIEPIPPKGDMAMAEDAADMSKEPQFRRVCGRAANVTVQRTKAGGSVPLMVSSTPVRINSSIDFKCYQFTMSGKRYVMFASTTFGGGEVFLAEKDAVEVIVAGDDPQDKKALRLVWAMRNAEDGGIYACHRIMSPVATQITRPLVGAFRMTQMTGSYWRSLRRFVVTVWIAIMLMIGGLAWAIGGGDAGTIFIVAVLMLPLVWLTCFELPMALWRWKWRLGHPSKRQRLAERVYALLGVGSPRTPVSSLIDV